LILKEQDLWDIVKGDETAASFAAVPNTLTPLEKKTFKKQENKARATILLVLDDKYLFSVSHLTTPTEVWTNLTKEFENSGLASKLFLKCRLFSSHGKRNHHL